MTDNLVTKEKMLMGRYLWEDVPAEIKANILTTVDKVNKFLSGYHGVVKVNDGLRRPQDKPKNGSATSWHYKGAAIDIDDDAKGILWGWMKPRISMLADLGLYIEDPRWTHGNGSWMHFQIFPPKSKKRVFVPSSKPAPAPKIWDGKYDAVLNY
jgi:hypothetical protein